MPARKTIRRKASGKNIPRRGRGPPPPRPPSRPSRRSWPPCRSRPRGRGTRRGGPSRRLPAPRPAGGASCGKACLRGALRPPEPAGPGPAKGLRRPQAAPPARRRPFPEASAAASFSRKTIFYAIATKISRLAPLPQAQGEGRGAGEALPERGGLARACGAAARGFFPYRAARRRDLFLPEGAAASRNAGKFRSCSRKIRFRSCSRKIRFRACSRKIRFRACSRKIRFRACSRKIRFRAVSRPRQPASALPPPPASPAAPAGHAREIRFQGGFPAHAVLGAPGALLARPAALPGPATRDMKPLPRLKPRLDVPEGAKGLRLSRPAGACPLSRRRAASPSPAGARAVRSPPLPAEAGPSFLWGRPLQAGGGRARQGRSQAEGSPPSGRV
jgi:hypothetical protein